LNWRQANGVLVDLTVELWRFGRLIVIHEVNISKLQLTRLSTTNAIWRLPGQPFLRLPFLNVESFLFWHKYAPMLLAIIFEIAQELLHCLMIIIIHHLRCTFHFLLFVLDIKQPRWQKR
jgi:hypothetical protein